MPKEINFSRFVVGLGGAGLAATLACLFFLLKFAYTTHADVEILKVQHSAMVVEMKEMEGWMRNVEEDLDGINQKLK